MIVATLALIGGTCGALELQKGSIKLGLFAISTCCAAFVVNLL
jgi:hypothetical protein